MEDALWERRDLAAPMYN